MAPDGHLDLWGREHYKSTIITFALTIQDILNDPEITVGIFSHTRGIAKGFLRQIKQEAETNDDLKALFPEILWANPRQQAPKWSEDDGIVFRRASNPKEQTVEAWGLVDGQPTSKHYKLRIYDDAVTEASVATKDQIEKTTLGWENSDNLGAGEGTARYIGTRWHLYDTYSVMMDRGAVKPRLHTTTHNGRFDGQPVFFAPEVWEAKKRTQSRRVIAAQHLMNPLADGEAMFRVEWLKGYEVRPRWLNVYIIGDPSKGAHKGNDNTAIAVIGVSRTGNRYLLDGYCHRMPQSRRWTCLRDLHRKWSAMPGVDHVEVGWERYGMQTDDEYFREQQQREKYFFNITEVSWTREGNESKSNRVERLEPDCRVGRFHLPVPVLFKNVPSLWRVAAVCASCSGLSAREAASCTSCGSESFSAFRIQYLALGEAGLTRAMQQAIDGGATDTVAKAIKRFDEERNVYDLTERFITEYESFPFGMYDDLLDACSRIYDLEPTAPAMASAQETEPPQYWDS